MKGADGSMSISGSNREEYVLPASDSASLILINPTTKQILQQAQDNATEWRGALSVEAYLRREEALRKTVLSRNGGITYWALVDGSRAPEDRQVLAGCETLRKRALVARNGKLEETISHGIGSVFTPARFRGKSYGSRMMKELGAILMTWQTEQEHKRCMFSVLYSDIGKRFYAKNAWHSYPSAHVHISPVECFNTANSSLDEDASIKVKGLYAADLPELCAVDQNLLRSEMHQRLEQNASQPIVLQLPDAETMAWHHAREEFVCNELQGKIPDVKGALATYSFIEPSEPQKAVNGRVWMIWTRMWYNEDVMQPQGNTFFVLRVVIEPSLSFSQHVSEREKDAQTSALASVLRVAQSEAAKWRMSTIELWNPEKVVVDACFKIDSNCKGVEERELESICALRWYGDSGSSEEATQKVEWLANEKFGWC